jgi:hypothetical protein
MNITTQQFTQMVALVILAGGFTYSFATPVFADTTVTNTVQVEADGSGESHAAVKTVVNGVVIEDWEKSSSGPIMYTHTATSTETETVVSVSADGGAVHETVPSQPTRDQLVELIERLQALIALYVSLLAH